MPKRRGKFRTRFKKDGKSYYAIRNKDGSFADIQSIGRAMKAERRKRAKTKVKSGHGFRGDVKK